MQIAAPGGSPTSTSWCERAMLSERSTYSCATDGEVTTRPTRSRICSSGITRSRSSTVRAAVSTSTVGTLSRAGLRRAGCGGRGCAHEPRGHTGVHGRPRRQVAGGTCARLGVEPGAVDPLDPRRCRHRSTTRAGRLDGADRQPRRRQVSYRVWATLRAVQAGYDVSLPTWVIDKLANGPFAPFEWAEERVGTQGPTAVFRLACSRTSSSFVGGVRRRTWRGGWTSHATGCRVLGRPAPGREPIDVGDREDQAAPGSRLVDPSGLVTTGGGARPIDSPLTSTPTQGGCRAASGASARRCSRG